MELTIPALTKNLIGLNSLICFLLVLVVWAYLFGRVKFSQALLGAFSCVVLMLVENLIDSFALADGSAIVANAVVHTVYIAAFVALLRAAVQYGVIRFQLSKRFDSADAALGFAIGFAALELIVGGISNLTTYTLCVTCNNEGLASILANAATPEEAASIEAMLTGLANANSWEQIFSCINRLFYLIQCMSVAVLCWYACTQKDIKVLLFAILGHSLVRLPYGLYTAGLLTDFRAEELVTYVLSLGFGLLAVQYYNRLEGGKFKFKGDRLAVRRRR